MFLYVFSDALTGEIQQPILAHNDNEAIRIAQMAFANVPQCFLHDLFLARVKSYEHGTEPKFDLDTLYLGKQFISETESNND